MATFMTGGARKFLLSGSAVNCTDGTPTLPAIGFGVHGLKGAACTTAAKLALKAGYCCVDTASVYNNEKEVGACLASSGLARKDLFVQTKLWRSYHADSKAIAAELQKSLRRLRLEYVDLWLIHWLVTVSYVPISVSDSTGF